MRSSIRTSPSCWPPRRICPPRGLSRGRRLPSLEAKRELRSQIMGTKAISDDSFQADVLDSDTPVLVDFWAEWCGPCKMIGPALAELSDDLNVKVVIAKPTQIGTASCRERVCTYG